MHCFTYSSESFQKHILTVFSLFIHPHVQAMNEYRGGEMSMEVVLDQICGRKLWTVNGNESVLRACLHGRAFNFRMHGPSSRSLLTFFSFRFLFFSFLFFFFLT